MRKCLSLLFASVAVVCLASPKTATKATFGANSTLASEITQRATVYNPKAFQPAEARKVTGTSALAMAHGNLSRSVANNTPTVFKASASTVLYGSVIYDSSWSTSQAGIYSMPVNTNEGSLTLVSQNSRLGATGGGVLAGDDYIATYKLNFLGYLFITHYVFDAESWELKGSYDGSVSTVAVDETYDYTTGTVYGCFYNDNGDGYVWGKLDTTSFTRTAIADLENPLFGVAAAPDGTIYGIDKSGILYKVEKTTGELTTIGDTGLATAYVVSATCDPVSGDLYYTLSPEDETGWLYKIDTTTATATALYQFPGDSEVTGLFIPAPKAEDKAPDAVTGLTLDFTEGSLSGNVNFTAPTQLYDGTSVAAGTEGLTYTIKANGTEVATGAATYGQALSVPVTVSEAGQYEIIVTVANSVGSSPRARAKAFIGNDTPKAVTNLILAYADGKLQLTWDAVTESVNGGYVNPQAVTYNVYDASGELVAEGLTATSWAKEQAVPADQYIVYKYSVKAVFAGLTSSATTSNAVGLGAVIPPYAQSFDDSSDFDTMSVIDANDDGVTWAYNSGKARIRYNSKLAMDDWLITPPVKLEKGKLYNFSFLPSSYSASFPERVEVLYGKEATATGLNVSIIPSTDIAVKTADAVALTGIIIPDETGTYYVGIHGISDADEFYLYADDITIGEGLDASIPAAVTDLTVTPAADGALSANIKFTTPAKTAAGDDLTADLTKVEIYRGDDLIQTYETTAPGTIIEYVDNAPANGDNTYKVVAYNATGKGLEASTTVFVGINYPAAVTSLSAVESTTVGTVDLAWDAVTTDINGNALSADKITYSVKVYNGSAFEDVATGLTATSYSHVKCSPEDDQDFAQYEVVAVTVNGEGSGAYSGLIPVGKAYTLPYDESFADGTISYILGTQRIAGTSTSWSLGTDSSISGLTSYDADNGYAYMKGSNLNDEAALFTGKINITGAAPALSFYTLNIATTDLNEIRVKVDALDGQGQQLVYTHACTAQGEDGLEWAHVLVPLTDYVGKTVQIYLDGVVLSHIYIFVDNIHIGELVDYDLAATNLTAPANVNPNEAFNVEATIDNYGSKEATDYTVTLYRDCQPVETKNGENLASFGRTTVTFDQVLTPLQGGEHEYYVTVNYNADLNADNNTSSTAVVTLKENSYPTVELNGAKDEETGGALLNWTAPNLTSDGPVDVIESFESAESYAQSYTGWTFVDVDNSPVGGFNGMTIPGITTGTSTASFIVFDTAEDPIASSSYVNSFAANSGTKYLASLFRADGGQADDWAISPKLSGNAQTISFYAKSYSSSYAEAIEVYYSTTDTDVANFTLVEGSAVASVPGEWTKYEIDLPQGAKYFAVRSCATDAFMLQLDDFAFNGYVDVNASLEVLGYNIYRDGVKVNDAVVTATDYLDKEAVDGVHSYVVTVVYNNGESKPSNEVVVTTSSGIADILAAASKVSVEAHSIIVSGAADLNVTVVAADGKVLYNAAGSSRTVVTVAPGVYVVKVGTKVTKVVVK